MTSKGFFRLLIVIGFLWIIVTAVVFGLTIRYLPQPLLDYVMQHAPDRPTYVPQSAGKGVALAMMLFMLAVSIATIVGLWCFRRWARVLLVFGMTFGFVSQIFAGPAVLPGAVSFCFSVGAFLQGVLVAVAFLPPITNLFSAADGLTNR